MTSIELLKQDLNAELKLGTKMVVNWDMYIEMHKQEMKEMYLKGIENYDPTFKRKDDTLKDYHIVDTNEMVSSKTAFEILQSKLTIADTFEFREIYLPQILDAMEEYKSQLPQQEKSEKPINLEISDEEIQAEAIKRSSKYQDSALFENTWEEAIEWYKEKLQLLK